MRVQIEVSTRCNFDCFYCAGRHTPQKDMSFEAFKDIIDKHVVYYGIPEIVSLQGEGEPTLNRTFFEMAVYVKGIGSRPYTITNGTSKNVGGFTSNFKSIGVSVDTLDAVEAVAIGRHNLKAVLNFIDDVGKSCHILVHSVRGAVSLESTNAVTRWCENKGYTHIVQPLSPKEDYVKFYKGIPTVKQSLPRYFSCNFLSTDSFRYYDINGVELPCCFIKDVTDFKSIFTLKDTLRNRVIPSVCKGCVYLK